LEMVSRPIQETSFVKIHDVRVVISDVIPECPGHVIVVVGSQVIDVGAIVLVVSVVVVPVVVCVSRLPIVIVVVDVVGWSWSWDAEQLVVVCFIPNVELVLLDFADLTIFLVCHNRS
jgi:hypothetical protein